MLLVQLYSVITFKPVLSEVFYYAVEGEAQIYPWGSENWQKAYSGTRILQGDALKTSKDSKVILEFFDGTKVRMGEDSEIVFEEIKSTGEQNEFIFTLRRGDMWVNKSVVEDVRTDVIVNMANIKITSIGTVFALTQGKEEKVRIVKGKVKVDVLKPEDDEVKVVDSFEVGVGQEAIFGAKEIREFREYKRPYVLEALSDEFKLSDWYKWNAGEDKNPTVFSSDPGVNTSVLTSEPAT